MDIVTYLRSSPQFIEIFNNLFNDLNLIKLFSEFYGYEYLLTPNVINQISHCDIYDISRVKSVGEILDHMNETTLIGTVIACIWLLEILTNDHTEFDINYYNQYRITISTK